MSGGGGTAREVGSSDAVKVLERGARGVLGVCSVLSFLMETGLWLGGFPSTPKAVSDKRLRGVVDSSSSGLMRTKPDERLLVVLDA